MTAEHLAALHEGRRRHAEEQARERDERMAAFRAWSKRDAKRWRRLQDAQEAGDRELEARIRAEARADPMPKTSRD